MSEPPLKIVFVISLDCPANTEPCIPANIVGRGGAGQQLKQVASLWRLLLCAELQTLTKRSVARNS